MALVVVVVVVVYLGIFTDKSRDATGGMWHLLCFEFEFYIEMFFGDTLLRSRRLKKGNVTTLQLLKNF